MTHEELDPPVPHLTQLKSPMHIQRCALQDVLCKAHLTHHKVSYHTPNAAPRNHTRNRQPFSMIPPKIPYYHGNCPFNQRCWSSCATQNHTKMNKHTQYYKKQATVTQSKFRQDESSLHCGSCPVDGSGDRKSTRLPGSLHPSIS